MGQYFRGWGRKAGLAALLIACIVTVLWLCTLRGEYCYHYVWRTSDTAAIRVGIKKSQLVLDSISAGRPLFVSSGVNQAIAVWKDPVTRTLNYPSQGDTEIEWTHQFGGFGFGKYLQDEPFAFHFKTWRIPYWSVVMPLSVISAWLLFTGRRQPKVTDSTLAPEA